MFQIYINAWGDNIPEIDEPLVEMKFYNLLIKEYKGTKSLEFNSRSLLKQDTRK